MQWSSVGMRLGSMLLLIVAGFVGLIAHYFIFVNAMAGRGLVVVAIVAAKAILAVVGGYLSERALRMTRKDRLIVFGAYELVPLLMPVLAAVPAWFLFLLPDLAAGAAGIALAREVGRRLVPARS